jgi:hypothetical protein
VFDSDESFEVYAFFVLATCGPQAPNPPLPSDTLVVEHSPMDGNQMETGRGEIPQENWLRSANTPLSENTRQNWVRIALSGQLPAGSLPRSATSPHFNWVRSAEMRSYANPFATCARVPPIGFFRKYYVAENRRQIGFELRGGDRLNKRGPDPALAPGTPLWLRFAKSPCSDLASFRKKAGSVAFSTRAAPARPAAVAWPPCAPDYAASGVA